MSTTKSYPALRTPGRISWRPAMTEAQTETVVAQAPTLDALCLECAHAELFTEQPRARCRCADSLYAGKVVFAGQPACAQMAPRGEDDLSLAWCSPALKAARGFMRTPKRAC